MADKMTDRIGVHRGRINASMVLAEIEKRLQEMDVRADVQITGSMGGSGHKYRDIDVMAKTPPGLPKEKLEKIEKLIQDTTGADFYFEDN